MQQQQQHSFGIQPIQMLGPELILSSCINYVRCDCLYCLFCILSSAAIKCYIRKDEAILVRYYFTITAANTSGFRMML